MLRCAEFVGKIILPIGCIALFLSEIHLLRINSVFSPCRGTSEWSWYGASMSRVLFKWGADFLLGIDESLTCYKISFTFLIRK
ncbi:hypothetical protein DWW10_08525 [Bacteroides intestinalis]|uniref:Uncharacterized protein n=1 Tax=Bacteroides intestinalis TaxID=329854 RepID=A0A412YDF1_9BACE|nr:hypothetical protein DWW10_08525 [Bacteroides intestinalis]RHA60298.1 hypothetical protein DW932_09870 [Bacteroides intestinalis]